jgi:hypothetical protein
MSKGPSRNPRRPFARPARSRRRLRGTPPPIGRSLSRPLFAEEGVSEGSERGKPASFDRDTGEVHGSGADAGGAGDAREDHDARATAGGGERPADGAPPPKDDAR